MADNGSVSKASPLPGANSGGPAAGVRLDSCTVVLDPQDDVAVCLRDLPEGLNLALPSGGTIRSAGVPRGHKIALRDLPEGGLVRKYGQVIGVASAPIGAGEQVHAHNLALPPDHDPGASPAPDAPATPDAPTTPGRPAAPGRPDGAATASDVLGAPTPLFTAVPDDVAAAGFLGFHRPDGRVGTRNVVAVLASVNCSAATARMIAGSFTPAIMAAHPGVDGVIALTHQSGCGLIAGSPGANLLVRTLRGYLRHPNIGAVLVIGLGCEMVPVTALVDGLDLPGDTLVETMTVQDSGGVAAAVRQGVDRVARMLPVLAARRRAPAPTSALVLGLNCGGSDGYSGITANPALGLASDRIVAAGGTSILAETPELFGAEHVLLRRAVTPEVARRLGDRLRWWQQYAADGGGSLDNNPSPGNKAGGLTTIIEKSLGAVAKGGRAPLTAVYEYAEQVTEHGLVFMDTPGYDPVSVTGLIAGGATVVCFTTGRGSVLGSRPAPTLKLATNSEMYRRMPDDMDLDCGRIVTGEASLAQVGDEVLRRLLAVASGEPTSSELLGLGQDEFVPWPLGAVT